MMRVNCGGVHAEVMDGFVVRSAVADAVSRLLAVSVLRGGLGGDGDGGGGGGADAD
jgi:hypothetical protein